MSQVISSPPHGGTKGFVDMSFSLSLAVPARARIHQHSLTSLRALGWSLVLIALAIPASSAASPTAEQAIRGSVHDVDGTPIVGAMVTLRQGMPFHERTVFTNHAGEYRSMLQAGAPFTARVRRIG
jgi:hypothetical protein